jgi:hypothetical protein
MAAGLAVLETLEADAQSAGWTIAAGYVATTTMFLSSTIWWIMN